MGGAIQCQSDIGVFQLPLFEVAHNGLDVCPVCHDPFKSRVRKTIIQKTCSRKCGSIRQRSSSIRFCEQCGTPFKIKNFEKETHIYCSVKCFHEGSKGKRRSIGTEFKKGLIPEGGFATRFKKGIEHPKWKGGISGAESSERRTKQYKEWARSVYKKDSWKCQECGTHCEEGNIIAHHIKAFSDYPELRFELENGTTLCRPCHLALHKQLRSEGYFPCGAEN